jgi:hypothetical protein
MDILIKHINLITLIQGMKFGLLYKIHQAAPYLGPLSYMGNPEYAHNLSS